MFYELLVTGVSLLVGIVLPCCTDRGSCDLQDRSWKILEKSQALATAALIRILSGDNRNVCVLIIGSGGDRCFASYP